MTDIKISSFQIVGKNLHADQDFDPIARTHSFDVLDFWEGRAIKLGSKFQVAAGEPFRMVMEIDGADNTVTFRISRAKSEPIEILKAPLNDIVRETSLIRAVDTLQAHYAALGKGESAAQEASSARRHALDALTREMQTSLSTVIPGLVSEFEGARRIADVLRTAADRRWLPVPESAPS